MSSMDSSLKTRNVVGPSLKAESVVGPKIQRTHVHSTGFMASSLENLI